MAGGRFWIAGGDLILVSLIWPCAIWFLLGLLGDLRSMRLHLRLLCEAHIDDSIVSVAVSGFLDSVDVKVTRACTGLELYQLCRSCSRSMLYCVTSWSSCNRHYVVFYLLVHLYTLALRSTSLPDMSLTGLRQAGFPRSLIDTTIVCTHVSSRTARMHKSTTWEGKRKRTILASCLYHSRGSLYSAMISYTCAIHSVCCKKSCRDTKSSMTSILHVIHFMAQDIWSRLVFDTAIPCAVPQWEYSIDICVLRVDTGDLFEPDLCFFCLDVTTAATRILWWLCDQSINSPQVKRP
jgi:hypothetical protein